MDSFFSYPLRSRFLASLLLCLSALLPSAHAKEKDSFWDLKFKKIQKMQARGDSALQEIRENQNSVNSHIQTALFAFDLDETLTDFPYRGRKARADQVHLKGGIGKLFAGILKHGHRIAIITANASSDVESFLMEKLGFDYRQEADYMRFRELIHLKQPDLPQTLRMVAPLKPHKGQMLREALQEFHAGGIKIDAVIFSDDKTGFHEQILSQDIPLPIVGLRVGHRPHRTGDPIGSFLDKDSYSEAGSSLEFAALTYELARNPKRLTLLSEKADRAILTDSRIRILNGDIFQISRWDFKNSTHNRRFGYWAMREFEGGRGDLLEREGSCNRRSFFCQSTRKFFNKKPVRPRYLRY